MILVWPKPSEVTNPVNSFRGAAGECVRNRACATCPLLLLDEPTNHFDLTHWSGWKLAQKYQGTSAGGQP
jgi:hypothetical protein